eukprot:CFRG6420T1
MSGRRRSRSRSRPRHRRDRSSSRDRKRDDGERDKASDRKRHDQRDNGTRDRDSRRERDSGRDKDRETYRKRQRDHTSERGRGDNKEKDTYSSERGTAKTDCRERDTYREKRSGEERNENKKEHGNNEGRVRSNLVNEDARTRTGDEPGGYRSKVQRSRDRDRLEEEQAKNMQYGKQAEEEANEDEIPKDKEKPNFALSGMLAKETNTFNGVELKYAEPIEARKPKLHWRLYPYKGKEELPILHIHRQSAYLLGRDRKVVDIPLDHPSCSNQHAAIQFRLITTNKDDGTIARQIKPYLIDLDSANGTLLNKAKIKPRRYHELKMMDSIQFGFSSREYVMMYAEFDASEAPP